MIKKILLGILLVGASGALVFGAINRTNLIFDKENGTNTARSSEDNQGSGRRGNSDQAVLADDLREHEYYENSQINRNASIDALPAGNRSTRDGNGNGNGGQGNGSTDGTGTGTGAGTSSGAGEALAYAQEWLTLEGSVITMDSDELIVSLIDGSELLLDGRAWSFAQESGFTTSIGNSLQLNGFYDGDDFEVGSINDLSSGESILLRDESGRPLWAGNGRWN